MTDDEFIDELKALIDYIEGIIKRVKHQEHKGIHIIVAGKAKVKK